MSSNIITKERKNSANFYINNVVKMTTKYDNLPRKITKKFA